MKNSLPILAVAIILSGCSYALDQLGLTDKPSNRELDPLQQKLSSEINFKTLRGGALKTCADCHTSGSLNVNSESSVIQNKLDIWRAVETDSMPPKSKGYKSLSNCDKAALQWWLNATASDRKLYKEIAACSPKQPLPSPSPQNPADETWTDGPLNFATFKEKIVEPKCLKCHSSEKAKETVLETYLDFKFKGLFILPIEQNALYFLVSPGAEDKKMMPPRTSTIAPLTEKELSYLKRWLEVGAPETADQTTQDFTEFKFRGDDHE